MHQTRQLFDGRRLANDCRRIFQDPTISKNIFHFPASPAMNDTLGAYCPTSGTGNVNSAEIRFGVPKIFMRERKRVRSAGNGVVVGEVRKTITVSLSRLMNSACASQIRPRSDSPSLRNARTDGHRQTDTSPLCRGREGSRVFCKVGFLQRHCVSVVRKKTLGGGGVRNAWARPYCQEKNLRGPASNPPPDLLLIPMSNGL